MDPAETKRHIKHLVIYSVIVCLSGWIGVLLDKITSSPPGRGPGMLLWILAPLLVSFSIRRFSGEGWSDLGLKLKLKGNRLPNLVSILFYPVIILIVIYVGKLVGKVHTHSATTLQQDMLLATFSAMIFPQLIQNIFEESGFRGFMSPKLEKMNVYPLYAHFITGLIWGLWHIPYMRAITSYSSEALLTLIPRFLLGTIIVSILYGEIHRRTKSVWNAIIMQTMGGAFIGTVLHNEVVRIEEADQKLFNPTIEGGMVILVSAIVGLLFLRSTLKRTDKSAADD